MEDMNITIKFDNGEIWQIDATRIAWYGATFLAGEQSKIENMSSDEYTALKEDIFMRFSLRKERLLELVKFIHSWDELQPHVTRIGDIPYDYEKGFKTATLINDDN